MARFKYHCELFDSVAEYVHKLNTRPFVEGAHHASISEGGSWSGTETYEEANELASRGDSKAAALIGNEMRRFSGASVRRTPQPTSVTRRSVVGSRPCVAAAIQGHPMSMYRRSVTHVQKPVITLVYNVGASASVSADKLAATGARVAQAIRNAERSGVKINLYVGDAGKGGKEVAGSYVKVKNSEKDFNLMRMAYPFANPAFLRRHWFRWLETCTAVNWSNWGGHGIPIHADKDAQNFFENELKKKMHYDIFLTYGDASCASVEELTHRILSK